MGESYKPKEYWEQRLSRRFSLRGVGHQGFREAYNNWLYRRKERCIDACLADIDLKDKDVLDIGCGTGFFVNWYLEHGANVCGLDITSASVERLKKKHQCEFHMHDVTDPDYVFDNRKFDIVNMWDVVYHIVEPERWHQAFDNITKSLKDGGLLLFTDWFGARADKLMANHVQARCLDTYKPFLLEKGFELVNVYPLYNYLNNPHLGMLDNYLGGLYFYLDNHSRKIPDDNLSLGLWRYKAKHS